MSIIVELHENKQVREALDWAKRHCPSYITNDVYMSDIADHSKMNTALIYRFYFDKEAEASWFRLRWE
jgi:hypothetical protein